MSSARARAVSAPSMLWPLGAFAPGHGPVFGVTTPTNGAGAWTVDFGVMGRTGSGDSGAMTRAMLTCGFTEDVQVPM